MTHDAPVPSGAPADAPGRLPWWFLGLTALVVVAGTALRFWGLARQSYWNDEMFSVSQAAGDLAHALDVGRGEVHPPSYAVLLTLWESLGGARGTEPSWTRLLSALAGLLSVLVAWTSLRRTPLSPEARALAVAAIAASGFGIVYAQETRSYSLLLLAATGLTGAVARWVLAPRDVLLRRLPWAAFLAWGLLASGTHLFGAVLAVASVLVLVVLRHRWKELALLVGMLVVVTPQIAWYVSDPGRAGFSTSTSWIPAPTSGSVVTLLTTVFASGGLRPDLDGFPWTSTAGLVVVGALLVVAAVAGMVARRRTSDWRGAAALLLLGALVLGASYVASQSVHVWTTRNLIVVVPALVWGTVWLALALAGAARRLVAVLVLAALGAGLVAVAQGVSTPYKNDVRGALEYLAAVRAEHPDATFVVSGGSLPYDWFLSVTPKPEPGEPERIFSRARYVHRPGFLEKVPPVPGPVVYVYYRSVATSDVEGDVAALLARVGGPSRCAPVPVYGLAVVRCDF